jgi:hypothetical protein
MSLSLTDPGPRFFFPTVGTTASHAIITRYGEVVHDVENPSANAGFRYEYTPAPYLDQSFLLIFLAAGSGDDLPASVLGNPKSEISERRFHNIANATSLEST